jgi:hypothetical protein
LHDLEATGSSGSHDDSYEVHSAESSSDSEPDEGPSTSGVDSNRRTSTSSSGIINLHRYPYVEYDNPGIFMVEPPPYPHEPPPSYEEAIAGSSFHLDPMLNFNDNPDFLW